MPPHLGLQQLTQLTGLTPAHLACQYLALAQGLVDLLAYLLLCLLRQLLTAGPVMVIKATALTTFTFTVPITIILVLLIHQDVEHLLRVHATEPRIKQPLLGQRDKPTRVPADICNDQVDHVVACHVGSTGVLLIQMLPQERMLERLVQVLVHDQATQVRLTEGLNERLAVDTVDAVGAGSRHRGIHLVLAHHDDARILHRIFVGHQLNVSTLDALKRGHLIHLCDKHINLLSYGTNYLRANM